MNEVTFPPLMQGEPVAAGVLPFDAACGQAQRGCDAGTVFYRTDADTLKAAIVFAPEVPLKEAVVILPICGVGFQNALGALAPPEVAVQLEWSGGLRVNGGRCGQLRLGASHTDPEVEPDWMVVGLDVSLWPASDETGETPEVTALYAEGCAEVDAVRLLESWARHALVHINRWAEEGAAPLHKEWTGLAYGIGKDINLYGAEGRFLGVDENFGLLLQSKKGTTLIPMIRLLEDA